MPGTGGATVLAAGLLLAGSAAAGIGAAGASGRALPVAAAAPAGAGDYRIGPLDVLSVTVFQEPDLTFRELPVDASGALALPLIGTVAAAGRTTAEVSHDIAARLNQRFLKDAQVSVAIAQAVSRRVTVEGSVTEPGVYELSGHATLLEALARAKSPTRTAALDQVVIFRTADGQRRGAVFNLRRIRSGQAADPAVLGGDTIVVGYSTIKGAFRDFLTSGPLLNLFRPF